VGFNKTHFALPLIEVYVLSGRWRVGIAGGITAFCLYVIGVLMQGPSWVAIWFKYAAWAIWPPMGFEADKGISWLGLFKALALTAYLHSYWDGPCCWELSFGFQGYGLLAADEQIFPPR